MSALAELVTVFCVDDHPGFRQVLRDLVAATPGFTHVGEAACGEEAIDTVSDLRPDTVLLDVRMPGMGGFEAARILSERRRDLVVILTSAEPIAPPRGFASRGAEVTVVAKQDLCPRALLDLWHGRRTR